MMTKLDGWWIMITIMNDNNNNKNLKRKKNFKRIFKKIFKKKIFQKNFQKKNLKKISKKIFFSIEKNKIFAFLKNYYFDNSKAMQDKTR